MKKRFLEGLDRLPAVAIYLCFLLLVIGLGIGYFVGGRVSKVSYLSSGALRLSDPEHRLISPLLLSDSGREADKGIADKLKLETYDLLNLPEMKNVSIYFRDLKTGIWAGVGEDTEYDPASLLKVPIMIAWYKEAESDSSVLSRRLAYTGPITGAPDDTVLHVGTAYTVDSLIKTMIEKSDNGAKDLLLANLDNDTIDSVFTDLGIESWGTSEGSSKHVSPIIYSRFLRILFNASYLDRDYSERALELLSSTDFNGGIVAGVPEGTAVAHKFGSYTDPAGSTIELHDCGIVYYPSHPYLICVMTRGTGQVDVETLESVIKTASKAVYDIVDKELAQ